MTTAERKPVLVLAISWTKSAGCPQRKIEKREKNSTYVMEAPHAMNSAKTSYERKHVVYVCLETIVVEAP